MSTVNLDCRLDLKSIALQARNAEYNPKVKCALRYGQIWTVSSRQESVLHIVFAVFSAYILQFS